MEVEVDELVSQQDLAVFVGISRQAVNDLVQRGHLEERETLRGGVRKYCSHLREVAAGRVSGDGINLATERALLAREQRRRIEVEMAEKQRLLVPTSLITIILSDVARQIASAFESLPSVLRRASDKLTAADIELVTETIVRARNIAARVELSDNAAELIEQALRRGSIATTFEADTQIQSATVPPQA